MTGDSRSRRWFLRPGFLALWAVLVVAALLLGPRLVRLPGLVTGLRGDLAYYQGFRGNLKARLAGAGSEELLGRLPATGARVHRMRTDWGWLLSAGRALRWVPGIGGDLAASGGLVQMADETLAGAVDLLPIVRPALAGISGQGDLLAGVTAAIAANPDAISLSAPHWDAAAAAWGKIDITRLSGPLHAVAAEMAPLVPALSAMSDLMRLLPILLGDDQARRFLVLAQNSDELRATGGFISGVGLLTTEAGKVQSLTFSDSYSIMDLKQPHPLPPAALEQIMGAEILLFRDANWWLDFPTSARMAQQLYAQDARQSTDGVIALDTQALQILIEAVGPVVLQEYGDTVTAANLVERMEHYWAAPAAGPGEAGWNAEWYSHRKDFMGVLAGAMVQKLLHPGDLDPVALARAAMRLLQERHLLLYVPSANDLLAANRWDGALVASPADYLMVADSNVGFNKVNPIIAESIAYTVTIAADGSRQGELRVRYVHRSTAHLDTCVHEARYGQTYADMMDRCYWDYVRVLVPAGSTLISREGLQDVGLAEAEGGYAVFDGLLVLAPGDTRDVVFRFALPPAPGPYRLFVQKQAGTTAIPLRIAVQSSNRDPSVLETDLSVDRDLLFPR